MPSRAVEKDKLAFEKVPKYYSLANEETDLGFLFLSGVKLKDKLSI